MKPKYNKWHGLVESNEQSLMEYGFLMRGNEVVYKANDDEFCIGIFDMNDAKGWQWASIDWADAWTPETLLYYLLENYGAVSVFGVSYRGMNESEVRKYLNSALKW